jgi:N-acetylmuramoyl-L-alanine amidase
VLKLGEALLCLLVLLAGCATAPRGTQGQRAPDWNSAPGTNPPIEVEHVSEPIRMAPPPANGTPAGERTNTYAETWIPLDRWSRENHTGFVRQISPAPLPAFALNASNGVLVVQANTRSAKWNGMELRLGFEPQMIDTQPFVHVLDLKNNIIPLLQQWSVLTLTNRVIVIDAGHGGLNFGTKSVVDGADEKEFTLDWAKRLEPLLAANGWKIFLTRTNDADVSLSNRIAFADACQASLFISLHFNSAAPSKAQAGLETFCLTPPGMPSTLTRDYEDDPSQVFANNRYDSENLQFAMLLHQALLRDGGLADRGVRRARFMSVLRGQNRPAVLIEGGYLSNPTEARRIADPAYRQKLAEAVAAALK